MAVKRECAECLAEILNRAVAAGLAARRAEKFIREKLESKTPVRGRKRNERKRIRWRD